LKRVCVGRIGAPHGVRGEVKLWPFTADPLAVARYGELATADGTRTFEVEALRPARDHVVARLKGVRDRAAAEALRNLELFVPRDRLPAIEAADEFYHADLVGLAAIGRDGAAVGTIVAVHNFGAGDLLELRPHNSDQTILLPFTAQTVPEIDIKAGTIVLDYDLDAAKR
jgi:16S rRNA processing protein RimM